MSGKDANGKGVNKYGNYYPEQNETPLYPDIHFLHPKVVSELEKHYNKPLTSLDKYKLNENLWKYGLDYKWQEYIPEGIAVQMPQQIPTEPEEIFKDIPRELTEIYTENELPLSTQKRTEKIDPKTVAAVGAATASVGALGILSKTKYQPLPTEPIEDIELSNINDHIVDIPEDTPLLEDTPMVEEPIDNVFNNNQELRQRAPVRNPTQNPNIMEPMEIEEAVDALAGGTAAATGSAAASSGGAGMAALGALGVGGIIAGAIGTKKAKDYIEHKGAVLPGSDYIGPGNPIHIAPARSEADQIAKEHDIAYQELINANKNGKLTEEEFKNKLFAIDKTAIDQFSKQEDWHSFIGKHGLKFKTNIEQTLDRPIYPQCK